MAGTDEQTEALGQPSTFNGQIEQFQYGGAGASTSAPAGRHSAKVVPKQTRAQSRQAVGTSRANPSNTRIAKSTSRQKNRQSARYAPPSKYAHLKPLTDILEPNLICVFVGFNPGVQTATAGHAYAHPSNLFWKLLHRSGCTDRLLKPEEDVKLPRLYAMGNTNLVSRPTKSDAELSKEEQAAGVAILDAKIHKYKPEAVCIVGKSIWENIWKYRYGSKPSKTEFKHGWQDEQHNMGKLPVEGAEGVDDEPWPGARVFVATSSSGLDASTKPAQKEAIWAPFGQWVQERRQERERANQA